MTPLSYVEPDFKFGMCAKIWKISGFSRSDHRVFGVNLMRFDLFQKLIKVRKSGLRPEPAEIRNHRYSLAMSKIRPRSVEKIEIQVERLT